jgi:hypothetical protein
VLESFALKLSNAFIKRSVNMSIVSVLASIVLGLLALILAVVLFFVVCIAIATVASLIKDHKDKEQDGC